MAEGVQVGAAATAPTATPGPAPGEAPGAAGTTPGWQSEERPIPPWGLATQDAPPPVMEPGFHDGIDGPPTFDDGGEERNFSPDAEDDRRRTNLFRIGAAMTVAFFAPIIGIPGHPFIVPELSSGIGVFSGPALLSVIRILPVVAGVVVMIMARRASPPARGIATSVAGAALFGPFLLDDQVRSALGQSFNLMPGSMSIAMFLGLIAAFGLLIAVRTRWYRPCFGPAHLVGTIAAVSYFGYLLWPVDGTPAIVEPFQVFKFSKMAGFAGIAQIGCMAWASVLCLMSTPSTPGFVAVARARLAFRLLLASVFVPLAAVILNASSIPGAGTMMLPALTSAIKYGVMFGGMVLLIPIGVADLLVGRVPDS